MNYHELHIPGLERQNFKTFFISLYEVTPVVMSRTRLLHVGNVELTLCRELMVILVAA